MKRMKTLSVAAVTALALGAGACDDGLADLNNNPNAPTDVPAQYILPSAIQTTVERAYGQWFNLEFAGLFSQQWAKIQYAEEDRFELRPGVVDGWWNDYYAVDLADWQLIIEKGQETGIVNHEATALVMKSFTYQIMTDIWGDIPYTQALQGGADEPVTTPAYDAQSDIYAGMVSDLDAALALFDPGARTWGGEDLIYGGDIDMWMKFANSLKLRMAMRASDVSAGTAQTWAEAAANHAAGLITDNSETAALAFLESAPNRNPLFENAISRDDHAVSQTLVEMLGALNDPRLPIFAAPAAKDSIELTPYVLYNGDVYRGQPNGVPDGEIFPLATVSRIGDLWRDTDNNASAATPFYLFTAAETHFLLAEAALNGWNVGGTAQGHYEAGVRASMAMWSDLSADVEITTAEVDTYLAQPGVAWGTGDSNLELIIEQKWLALYTNGPEAYAEFRRTGYPDEIVTRSDHAFDFVPGRIPYPSQEQSLNLENLTAAMSRQGVDGTYTGTVWWDPVAPE